MKLPTIPWPFLLFFTAFILGFIIFNLISLLQPTHSLQNLEPYPDGMLYSLSARNLAANEGFGLNYQGSFLSPWVPPLYSLVLSVGYLFSQQPETFVVVNILLGVFTLALISHIVWSSTQSYVAIIFAIGAYLSHAVVLWLPTFAMSENLSVFLVIAGIWGLTSWKKHVAIKILIVICASGALVLTRYASIFLAISLVCLLFLQLKKQLRTKELIFLSALGIVGVGIIATVIGNPVTLTSYLIRSLVSGSSEYYSTAFIIPNVMTYLSSLAGIAKPFLWLQTPLSSIFLSASLLFITYSSNKKNLLREEKTMLLTLFLAQLPLMLIFYLPDSRYLIYSPALIALAVGMSSKLLQVTTENKKLIILAVILFVGHGSTQFSLLKQQVAANILGRSTAWQYEAIKHFDRAIDGKSEEVFIITALPPFLVDAYSTGNYRVLPLSVRQEFMAKNQWVWGSDLENNYPSELKDSTISQENLLELFDELLEADAQIYISNAYITHLHEVVADYENLKKRYQLELVSPGCQGACDLYKLSKQTLQLEAQGVSSL